MAVDIFGIAESSSFARALASSQGVQVREVPNKNFTPYSTVNGEIMVSSPSIYGHDEYMGHLHREISKQSKDMKFFHEVDVEKNELQQVAKCILQSQRTEHNLHGVYEGRDRILSNMYNDNMKAGGGVQEVVNRLALVNPTAAAMLYIGNEMRNDWQGFNYCEKPESIKEEVSRLRPILHDEWLKLDSKESLETLLNRIQYEEQDGNPNGDGEDSDGEGEGRGQGEGAANKDGDSMEGEAPAPGEDRETGDAEGEDGEGEGQPEDGDGEPTPESTNGEKNQPATPTDDSGAAQADREHEQQTKGDAHNNHGASEAYASLKDIGLIKEPVDLSKEQGPNGNMVPYTPTNDLEDVDCTKVDDNNIAPYYHEQITRFLGTFSLSKKIRKYLISQSQVGYELGKKRGKICSKNIGRIYAGHNQPRIFKQKCATKIQTDTAMFILGDASGSMSNERYTTSSCCQVAMSEVLQTLQIAHMMMQFSTRHKGRAHFIMKNFNERYVSRDTLIKRYASGKITMGCNADGEAVTAAAQMLAKRPEKNKLLIVLSDGSPAYHGRHGNDRKYLKDTVGIIEESKVMNIIGIGIQTSSVQKYYKNSKVVHTLDQLESVLLNLLREEVLK